MRKKRRKSINKKFIIFFLLSIIFVYFGYKFITSWSRFNIKNIKVRGNKRVKKEEVFERFGEKRNIMKISVNKIKKRIEDIPFVEKAKITKKLPDSIIIDLIEKNPVALLVEDNKSFLVDRYGNKIVESDNKNLPVIKKKGYRDKIIDAINDFNRLNKLQNQFKLTEAVLINNYDVGFKIKKNDREISINIGRGNFKETLRYLDNVFNRIEGNAKYIDLRYLPYVIYKN